ncbi:MAG: tetratricopeptide repeat protein [Planctomycetota bacterium]
MLARPRVSRRILGLLCLGLLTTPVFAQDDDPRAEATQLLREVLHARQAALGTDHPQVVETEKQLADALLKGGRLQEALPLLRHVTQATEKQLGPAHEKTLAAKEALALALLQSSLPSGVQESAELPRRSEELEPTPVEEAERARPGGIYRNRFGRRGGSSRTEAAVDLGLKWLAEHQSPDGRWDSDGFTDLCQVDCGGLGDPLNDIGLTGLALLSFLGTGNSTTTGPYKANVRNAVTYLKRIQDRDTGFFGDKVGQRFLYNHALASLAMVEAYHLSGRHPLLEKTAQGAVNYILRSRNPYKAWRYDSPPNGENDTAVTGWMVLVLIQAKEAGLAIDKSALDGALMWLDEMTNPETGRTGYITKGGYSARDTGTEDDFPFDKTEAMTAEALLARIFMGQSSRHPAMRSGAHLLRALPPRWRPEAGEVDMYYWFFGTQTMFQLGGRDWRDWNQALSEAVLPNQHTEETCQKGSWDPVGPWGKEGGRVYSTALMVLSLETPYRYDMILSKR